MNQLPSELARIEELAGKVHRAIVRARRYRVPVTIDVEEAQELVDMINDSLRTARRLQTHEFDGTAPLDDQPKLAPPKPSKPKILVLREGLDKPRR